MATIGLVQQPKDRDRIGRAHEYFAIGDHRRDVLVAGAELIAIGRRLIAVVQLMREIGRIISVQHGRSRILVSPHNGVGRSVG